MEFRIAAADLGRALHRAQGIVDRKTTMPILANVLLQAKKSGISVTGFDLDIGVVSEHPAEVMKEGGITLSARHLHEMVKLLPEAQVTLKKASNNFVDITSGPVHYRILGMAAEEFPPLPKEEKTTFFKADGKTLLEMIEKTRYAVSRDETRYILNGVLFESVGPNAARMVATDGHRLSMIERALPCEMAKRGVIIPHKGLDELRRLLEEAPDAECQLGFSETSATFKKPGLTMVMRLIDGQFPEYQQVIPKESDHTVKVRRVHLLDTLRRMSLVSADRAFAVKVSLAPGAIRITSQNPDLGDASEDIPVEYKGSPLTVGFNARYLMDVLEAVQADEMILDLSDEHSPGVLRPAGDPTFTAVVMPMRI
jgi:DNA polymerase III subunit beta